MRPRLNAADNINARPGSRRAGLVGDLAALPREREVLYKSGTRFEVEELRKSSDGMLKITLREVDDD